MVQDKAAKASRRRAYLELLFFTLLFFSVGVLILNHNECPTNVDDGLERMEKLICSCELGNVYPMSKQPKLRLAALVQSFNHGFNAANISASLSSSKYVDEVVICEDGSSDGSLEIWAEGLRGKQHVVIRSNNLHEMRSYNRASRVADSDIVVLLQDDDLLPTDETWLKNALLLFEKYPRLGVLSGYIGQTWNHETKKGYEFGEIGSTHGGARMGNTERIPFKEPLMSIPFMFVECSWAAPLFVRRSLMYEINGLDLSIARIGEPGVWQDCVLSFDAWVHGYQVAVYDGRLLDRGVGGHGSASSEEKMKLRGMVWERAFHYSNEKYNRPKMHDHVVHLNEQNLEKRAINI